MKKKRILMLIGSVSLALMLVVPIVAGCAGPAPSPTPSPSPTPAPARLGEIPAVTSGEVYEWTFFSMQTVETDEALKIFYGEIIPDLEVFTNGRLKIEFLGPGEHPYTSADLLAACSQGKTDMAWMTYGQCSFVDPRLAAADLPFLQPGGGHTVKKDMHRLLAPLYADLLDKWNVFELALSYCPAQQYWHVSEFLEDIDSLKGETIRTWCPELDDLVTMLGGIPIHIDSSEAYIALQTGLVDGVLTGVPFCVNTKMVEVVKFYQPLDILEVSTPFIVNKDSWNELPTEIQNAFLAYMDLRSEYLADAEIRKEALLLNEAVVKYGVHIGVTPPGLREQIVAGAYEGIWMPWAERVGPGGIEFLDMVVRTIEKAGYEVVVGY